MIWKLQLDIGVITFFLHLQHSYRMSSKMLPIVRNVSIWGFYLELYWFAEIDFFLNV